MIEATRESRHAGAARVPLGIEGQANGGGPRAHEIPAQRHTEIGADGAEETGGEDSGGGGVKCMLCSGSLRNGPRLPGAPPYEDASGNLQVAAKDGALQTVSSEMAPFAGSKRLRHGSCHRHRGCHRVVDEAPTSA